MSVSRSVMWGDLKGMRKVETAGRHQAVVIHTATGDHLRELMGLLRGYVCDDGVREAPDDDAEGFQASATRAGE